MGKVYFIIGVYCFIAFIIISAGILFVIKYRSANQLSCTTIDQKAVLGQTTRPALPDLVKNEGGGIEIDPISVIVNDNTFPYDIYLYSKEIAKTNPTQIEEMWQISDNYQVYFKSFFNDAIVTDPGREFILNIRYDERGLKTDQGIWLPENSVKIIYKDNVDDNWQMLDHTILNTEINRASVITNKGGYFAVVAGWWATPLPTPFPWATLWAKAKKLYPTKIPYSTAEPTITPLPQPTVRQPIFENVPTAAPNNQQTASNPVYNQAGVKCYTENQIRKDILDLILDDISKVTGVDL